MSGVRYNKRNFYLRVEAMQQEYLKHRNSGRSEMYIYRRHIYPRYYISRSTFYNWLTINPKKELERMQYQMPKLF